MKIARFITALLLALGLVAGALLWLQRQSTDALRAEVVLLREQQGGLAKLRVENGRLRAAQIAPDEFARLQGERAAVLRLRRELQDARERIERSEKALADLETEVNVDMRLSFSINPGGDVLLEGQAFAPALLRQQLSSLRRGSNVEFNFTLFWVTRTQSPNLDQFRQVTKEIGQQIRDLGLKGKIRML